MTWTSGSYTVYRKRYNWRTNGFAPWQTGWLEIRDSWKKFSMNHPSINGHYGVFWADNGGTFYLEKETHRLGPAQVSRNNLSYPDGTYTGPIVAGFATGYAAPGFPTSPSDSSIISDGAQAISRVHPSAPQFSFAQQMGELRERFPSLIGSSFMRDKVQYARASGNEYLNVEFGWKPLINSVRDFCSAVKMANSEINAHTSKMRTATRRRYHFPTVFSSDFQSTGGGFYPSDANITGTGHRYTVQRHDKWFAGAFVQWYPITDSLSGRIQYYEQEANKLLGTRLTPEVLWELAPWSWAVDWWLNIGEFFTNLSAVGDSSTVMKYGYMMNHLQTEYQLTLTAGTVGQGKTSTHTTTWDKKMRFKAKPYGFGYDDASLTPEQLAILAGIGLSRS